MKLSDQFEIDIPEEKIVGYVLSRTHKLGSLKAAYFKSYGFTSEKSGLFISAIKKLIKENEVTERLTNKHGITYLVEGKIKSPQNKMLTIRTVWMVEHKSDIARLITVYPK